MSTLHVASVPLHMPLLMAAWLLSGLCGKNWFRWTPVSAPLSHWETLSQPLDYMPL